MSDPDLLDLRLVDLLVGDGRRTYAELAQEVGLSQPAVKRRVDRLVADGVIRGFTAVVDHARLGRPLEAFSELRFQGTTSPEDMEGLRREIPEIEAIHILAGDFDALCHVRARDLPHLREVVARLRAAPGVVGTKTLMALGSAPS